MSKTFLPVFKETESDNLLEHLDISQERVDAITTALNEKKPKNVVEALKVVGEVAENANEYTAGVFIIGQHSVPNPLEEMLAAAAEGGAGSVE